MATYADENGRFLFAPQALTGAAPYIDRLALQCRLTVPGLSVQNRDEYLRHLAGNGSLFDAPYDRGCNIRDGWLFSGSVQCWVRGSSPRIVVDLKLNPTRFLQAYRVPNTLEERALIHREPWEAMREEAEALREAASSTLDGNNNYLTHTPRSYGRIFQWEERIAEYVAAAAATLDRSLERAYRRTIGSQFAQPLLTGEWSLVQAEFYWEFAVADAIHKMVAIAPTALQVLRDASRRDYRLRRRGMAARRRDREDLADGARTGIDRNSPYVSGTLMREGIRGRLYAKSWRTVRFEIAYMTSPLQPVRQRLPGETTTGSLAHILHGMAELSRDAQSRAGLFWGEFWERHDTAGPASPTELLVMIAKVQRVATQTSVPADALLSFLMHIGGGQPSDGVQADAVRALSAERVLVRCRTASSNSSMRYMVAPRFRPLVGALRAALASTEAAQEGLAPDEDPPSGRRLRLRARPLQPRFTRYQRRRALTVQFSTSLD